MRLDDVRPGAALASGPVGVCGRRLSTSEAFHLEKKSMKKLQIAVVSDSEALSRLVHCLHSAEKAGPEPLSRPVLANLSKLP